MPTRGQGLTPTENVDRGFILRPTLPAQLLSLSPIKWRCLYRVLWPVRSPVTTLACSLLRDKNLALVPRYQLPSLSLGRTKALPSPWFTSQRPILLLRSRFETPRDGSGPTDPLAKPFLASSHVDNLMSMGMY
jgi:hypothetical protein